MRRIATPAVLALVSLAMLGVGACSSDSATTSAGSNAGASSEPVTSTAPPVTQPLAGLEPGDHLVVAAPYEQEAFARLVAITVDDAGIPLIAYVSTPLEDTAKPQIQAVTYDVSTKSWRDAVVVGRIEHIRGVLRATSGASETVTLTFEAGADSATFTSSDGGATWAAAQPLPAGTGDPATATAPDGRTFTVHVVRTCPVTQCPDAAPGIYVQIST